MSPAGFAVKEADLEELVLDWLREMGWGVENGEGLPASERESEEWVVLPGRLDAALKRLNPGVDAGAREDALKKILNLDVPGLVSGNRHFHKMLVNGVEVEVVHDGQTRGLPLKLIDVDKPGNNDWLAVNQLTVIDGKSKKRPDVVLFVNGLPLAVLELKNPVAENADAHDAFVQLGNYKDAIKSLMTYNEALVVSDGIEARIGSLTAGWERFQPWRTADGKEIVPRGTLELEALIRGVFAHVHFLDLVTGFVAFEDAHSTKGASINKLLATYHQFFAAREAMDATLKATRPGGDRKVGVVWHTQGSGKSLTMLFYAGQVIRHAAMKNPTVVVITDRNDLDNQLFGQFARCRDLIRQDPVQAEDRDHLQSLLKVAGGGVVFTTIQKFLPEERGERFPMLSDRENIVVIADEAHRSQYGFRARVTDGAISAGFAQHLRDALPNASFIGFTGTPIELTDKSTRAVFGDYISVYDIQRAVEDKATVPIYYEGRFAKLDLDSHGKEIIDEEFDEATENEETFRKEKLKSKWARMEAIIGASGRIELIAKDIVEHFEQRTDRLQGKAMIVCMSRRICVELYAAIRKLRPAWHDDDPFQGAMKVIMTGSSADPKDWQPHIHSKDQLRDLADNFKDAEHPLRLVIVRDMWLTGFDAPSVHTMYVDKPMKGHGLMQAIARVNRVWRDKPGGLVVDYIGLAEALQQAVKNYTESGGKGQTTIDMAEAIAVMKEKLEICRGIFHGFDVDAFLNGNAAKRIQMLPAAADFILEQKDGRDRLANAVLALSKAHALCSADPEARAVADEVAFFEAVKVTVVKYTLGKAKPRAELDVAIRQIVSKAVAAEGVIDIFRAAGMSTPDITILSDSFLADVKAMPQKNLAAELLNKLLHDEVRALRRKNLVKSDLFSSKLEQAIARYRNRAIQTVEVIEELLAIAKALQEARAQGKELNLSEEEEAFFDALAANKSAVEVMGDQKLAFLAREVADVIRKNVSIDWTMKEQVRAKLRTAVKRKLRQHGYPPDLQEKAVETVIRQAELLADEWLPP